MKIQCGRGILADLTWGARFFLGKDLEGGVDNSGFIVKKITRSTVLQMMVSSLSHELVYEMHAFAYQNTNHLIY